LRGSERWSFIGNDQVAIFELLLPGSLAAVTVEAAERVFDEQNMKHVSHPRTDHWELAAVTKHKKRLQVFEFGWQLLRNCFSGEFFKPKTVFWRELDLLPSHLRTLEERISNVSLQTGRQAVDAVIRVQVTKTKDWMVVIRGTLRRRRCYLCRRLT
jgi:hypothetical protein